MKVRCLAKIREQVDKVSNTVRAVVVITFAFAFHGMYVLPTLWSMTNLPLLPDFFFDVIPFSSTAGHVADAVWVSLLVYFFVANRDDAELLKYFVVVAGILMFVRSLCVLLNPVMPPLGMTGRPTFVLHEFAPGMFFSGHVANSLLIYLMTPIRRTWMLFTSLVIAMGLVAARAHYSIDIVGGYAIGWGVYCFCERYLRFIFLGANHCAQLQSDLAKPV